MAINNRLNNPHTEDYRGNSSYDKELEINAIEPLEFDGSILRRKVSSLTAKKVTEIGNYTYIATAPIGTAQATAGWQVMRVEVSGSDTIITWADGDSAFDNIATSLETLSYS